jgi:D-3-phosphoglycerate dehydrogenase
VPELRRRRDRAGRGAVPVGDRPAIALAPASAPQIDAAVRAGGGRITSASEADAILWTNPADPAGLGSLLQTQDPEWVQLPFAGIESFFAAGVIDAGRTWTCAKGIYGPSSAEHALTLMLAVARRIHQHARAESWRSIQFGAPEKRLKGSIVLIVGTGGIGRALAAMLQPLEPRIIAVNRSGRPLEGAALTETVSALPHLLGEADFVVLAAASTSETRGLFDRALLEYAKEDAWLINVARGDLVVTPDLIAALEEGSIGGAALDVTDPEPLPEGHRLWSMDNVLITPHVANTWDMALPELSALIERNVRHFGSGEELEGLVDVELGY